jgi:hypothetical protein
MGTGKISLSRFGNKPRDAGNHFPNDLEVGTYTMGVTVFGSFVQMNRSVIVLAQPLLEFDQRLISVRQFVLFLN